MIGMPNKRFEPDSQALRAFACRSNYSLGILWNVPSNGFPCPTSMSLAPTIVYLGL